MRRNPPHRAPVAAREEQLRLAMLEPGILAGGQKVEQLALQRRPPGGVAAVEAEGEPAELALVRLGLDRHDGDGSRGMCGHLWFPGWSVVYSAHRFLALMRRWSPALAT